MNKQLGWRRRFLKVGPVVGFFNTGFLGVIA
jgi:hypothetical protein